MSALTGMRRSAERICERLIPYRVADWLVRQTRPNWPRMDLAVPAELSAHLDVLPSETTPRERRLLWWWFANMWNGDGDVVEVGPFLGGTSRAIAMGMLANPSYGGGKLRTYDRFEEYYSQENLRTILQPLRDSNAIDGDIVLSIGASASFRSIFEAIHSQFEYGRIIVAESRPLPDTVEQLENESELFMLPEHCNPSAYFIDGCKSWFATKVFMTKCCEASAPGATFIFQDYLQYTCFWIPSFVETFPEHFRLICHTDQTYAFALCKPLARATIEAAYPDDPVGLGWEWFERLFSRLRTEAAKRSDPEAVFKHALQHGAALAYVGETDRARRWFRELAGTPGARGYSGILKRAARTPTYRPGPSGHEMVRL